MLLVIFIVFGLCFILERIVPGWKLPDVPTWTIRVLAVNSIQLGIVVLAGYTWEKWFSAYSAFNLSKHVGPVWGGVIAYSPPLQVFRASPRLVFFTNRLNPIFLIKF